MYIWILDIYACPDCTVICYCVLQNTKHQGLVRIAPLSVPDYILIRIFSPRMFCTLAGTSFSPYIITTIRPTLQFYYDSPCIAIYYIRPTLPYILHTGREHVRSPGNNRALPSYTVLIFHSFVQDWTGLTLFFLLRICSNIADTGTGTGTGKNHITSICCNGRLGAMG